MQSEFFKGWGSVYKGLNAGDKVLFCKTYNEFKIIYKIVKTHFEKEITLSMNLETLQYAFKDRENFYISFGAYPEKSVDFGRHTIAGPYEIDDFGYGKFYKIQVLTFKDFLKLAAKYV
jgi:hypothetical protein